jgi:uncharacterized DUF497 family protein
MNKDQKKCSDALTPTLFKEHSDESFAARLGIKEHQFRLIIGTTRIDYDQNKEQINRKKHGYSLASAAYLLQRFLLPIPQSPLPRGGPFKRNCEYRYELMALDDDGHTVLFLVVTMRPTEIVRIISCRKACEPETEIYKQILLEHSGKKPS